MDECQNCGSYGCSSGANLRENSNFNDKENCPINAPCKGPEKVNGLDVEIAIRRPPFKNYPRKPTYKLGRKPKGWPYKTEEHSIPLPKCSPRFYLKRIYQLLAFNYEDDCQTVTNAWSLWKSYEKEAADVFIYGNVDAAANIILLLSLSCKHFSNLHEMFDKIMQRLQRGIYLGTPARELTDNKKMNFFFSCLGVAIVDGHVHAQTCIANILGVWLENLVNKRKLTTKKSRCSLSSRLMKGSKVLALRVPDYELVNTLEQSLLPTTLAKNLNKEDMPMDAYLCIVSLLKLCCEASPTIRERLWCLPVLDTILSKLSRPDPSNRILIKSIDFVYSYFGVYNMFQSEDSTAKFTPRISKESFQVLIRRFIQQLETPESASKSLLSIRNDTAFLLCLIGNRVPFCGEYYRSYGLTIGSMVTTAILGSKGVDNTLVLEGTQEDLELLQLMIFMLKSIVEAGRGEKIIKKCSLVAVLLTLLLDRCSLPIDKAGSIGKELHNTAWTTIHAIAKQFPMTFLSQQGASSLLTLLKTFGSTGDGNPATVAMALHTLRILLGTTGIVPEENEEEGNNSEQILLYLINRDSMTAFISVLYRLVQVKDDKFEIFQDTMVSNALYCCTTLGHCDLSQKEAFLNFDGVTLMNLLMQNSLSEDPLERRNNSFVTQIAISECICGCITHYPQALEVFLEDSGVLRVLDVLETVTSPEATVQLMNCLVQLCDYPRCLHQLLCWKRPVRNTTMRYVFGKEVDLMAKSMLLTSKEAVKSGDNLQELDSSKDLSLGSFFCSLWKDDEKRTEVLRDPEGCIESLCHPLMTKAGRMYEVHNDDTNLEAIDTMHRATIDLSDCSLRPKIYLLMKRIVEMTGTTSSLFDGLSLVNQIIMQVIINFMELKKSEVFTDMADEMHRHKFYFAPNDEEEATALVKIANNNISAVLETQRFLLRRSNELECIKETEFYNMLKTCRLQNHLQATREVDYHARATSYKYLVERRMWQMRELNNAERLINMTLFKNSRMHRTSAGLLNITAWNTRTKNVESEPKFTSDSGVGDYEENDPIISDDDYENEHGEHMRATSLHPFKKSAMFLLGAYRPPSYSISHDPSSYMSHSKENATPDLMQGGYYQVSPYLLRNALKKVVTYKDRNSWIKLVDDDEENQWKIGKKWRQDWYPLKQTRFEFEPLLEEEDEEEMEH